MKFIHARQVWTESQHESNVSISQAAEQRAEVATKLKTVRSASRKSSSALVMMTRKRCG